MVGVALVGGHQLSLKNVSDHKLLIVGLQYVIMIYQQCSFIMLQTALEAGNIAEFDADAWEDSDDDFLDNDDPLAAERWDLS